MKPVAMHHVNRDITAARDDAGVPHIRAQSWQDGLYGLGYFHATDRGTQLLFSRSIAAGKGSSEIANTNELRETDRFFRRVGLHRRLEEEVQLLTDSHREELAAYCDGVNDGITAMGRSLPMWATGFKPTPWDPCAVVIVGQLLSFGGLAVSQMQNERLIVELIHAGAFEEGLREMFQPRLDNVDFEQIRQIKMSTQLSDEALELLTDLPRLAGSNAWAVSPNRSESGNALLASDPHLEINRLPAIWYEAVIEFDDRFVMGATLPGCPLFAVARTPDVAWGVTYMKGDTADYFLEDVKQDDTGKWQYRRGNDWRRFDIREETITPKGDDAEVLQCFENEQGVLEGDPNELGAGLHLSFAWTGSKPGSGKAIGVWLDVVKSASTIDAMDLVRHSTQPSLCWIFADSAGHIGHQTSGLFPVRGNRQIGLAPIPAWDEANHWQGWIDAESLPRIYDPADGFVATANEEIHDADLPMLCTQTLNNYRKRRIDEMLAEIETASLADMQKIQYDKVSLQARDMLAIFLPRLPEGELKEKLSQWDCTYDVDRVEPAMFAKLYRNVLIEIFGQEQGIGWKRMVYLCSRAGFSGMIIAAIDRLLHQQESSWWRDRNKGDLIRKAAEALIEEETDEQKWGDVNYFHFADRYFGNHQVGRMLGFASQRYPMPGNFATPFQGLVWATATRAATFAPSYHFVTDLADDFALTNLPGGPNESRFSKYYNIDVPRWLTGEYKRLERWREEPS